MTPPTRAAIATLARGMQWELDAFAFTAPRGVPAEYCRRLAGELETLARQIREHIHPDHPGVSAADYPWSDPAELEVGTPATSRLPFPGRGAPVTEQVPDPDQWRHLGIHWHAHTEIDTGDAEQSRKTRADRLELPAEAILNEPDEAADWLAEMAAKHARPDAVRLIGPPPAGWGEVGDEAHLARDLALNLEVLTRGESLGYSFRREQDRMYLWVEAVSNHECREVHADP